ncbi:hypothetical protein AUK22_08970 [bacterium CG2_30_54_10]|nr:MAG: hypothetical protein AUK22_08970 [bacterium CG2_30_54_10]
MNSKWRLVVCTLLISSPLALFAADDQELIPVIGSPKSRTAVVSTITSKQQPAASPSRKSDLLVSPVRQALENKAATDPIAQYSLGMALLNGDFGAKSPLDAMRWLQASARKGYPPATTQIGRMHRDGLGVAADPFKAVKWFRVGAEAGFRPAQIELALMYFEGKGSHQDLVEAFVMLESASPTIRLAPEGEFAKARKALSELEKRLSPEQMSLARERVAEAKGQSLAAMMKRHPGTSKKVTPQKPVR